MKVKLDENIPDRLISVLANEGHDVDTVASEGLRGRPDGEIWISHYSPIENCAFDDGDRKGFATAHCSTRLA